MFNFIPTVLKKLWEKYNLRFFILLSLSLQTILILGAPLRKRTPNMFTILIIWSSYLLADWAANFAIGLISNSKGGATPDFTHDLLAFWAPFLLLHLGGPDTITAFALEDNTLWLRHFLGLIFQVIAAVYVFGQSLPQNKLSVPTLLLFLAGIIKYAERTRSLYRASLNNFKEAMIKKPDPGPNYAKLMEEYSSNKEAKLPTHIELTVESRTETYVIDRVELKTKIAEVRQAHRFYLIFRGLIVDLIFSFKERKESRKFFHDRTSKEAFEVMAIELNFMYEALFTKAEVVHHKKGYFFRVMSFAAVVAALILFFKLNKPGLKKFDIGITYTLLFGAIGLDLVALFMLVFSDWTVAALNKYWLKTCIATFVLENYLEFKRSSLWPTTDNSQACSTITAKCLEWSRRFLFGRWCESVSIFNLIDYSLREREKFSSSWIIRHWSMLSIKCVEFFGVKDRLDRIRYKYRVPLDQKLWNFIFDELKAKSLLADDPETAKKIGSARGDWVLEDSKWVLKYRNSGDNSDEEKQKVIKKLLYYVAEVEYDKSILLWHIATDLCYVEAEGGLTGDQENHRQFSKTLSDYMLYLLVMQPTMMSSVAGIGQTRFRDTCAEAKKFFSRRDYSKVQVAASAARTAQERFRDMCAKTTKFFKRKEHSRERKSRAKVLKEEACKGLLDVNTDVQPIDVKGDRSKSVLFDACILAKDLKKLKEDKWELMSRVWVELLAYTASHCRANEHAQLLSKGGELVTFVWLLMAHFGIGEQFQINEGHARAKLIVKK